MSPFPNVFEDASQFLPKKEAVVVENLKNVKLDALKDHIDYDQKTETFKGYIDDIEQGLYQGEYEMIDEEIGINFMGDPRTSLVNMRNTSPLLAAIEKELLARGYESNRGNKSTSFYKIFQDRKSALRI